MNITRRPREHTRSRAVAVTTVLALVAVACGGDDDAAEPSGATTAAADDAAAATTASGEPGGEATNSAAAGTDGPATTGSAADGGSGDDQALQELIAAAQAEGSVVFYTVPGENLATRLCESFTATYDIKCEFVRMTTPDTAARLTAEEEAGATVADLALITATDVYPALMEQGMFVRLDEAIPNYPDILPQPLPESFVKEEWGTAIPISRPAVIAYNTDLVAADEVPQSHEELSDPRWEGEVMTVNPMESTSYLDSFYQFLNLYGEDFITQLVDNGLQLAGSSAPATQALAAGEVSIVFGAPASQPSVLQGEGAPVDWVVPDVTTGSDSVIGIVTDAPHPNAARLLAYHLLTPEGSRTHIEAEGDATPFEGELPSGYEVFEVDQIPEDVQQQIYGMLGLN